MDAGAPVATRMRVKELRDLLEQPPVLFRVGTHGAGSPGIVAGAADAVATAEIRHPMGPALRVDEREAIGFRAEQNRIAFFRSACSSWSCA